MTDIPDEINSLLSEALRELTLSQQELEGVADMALDHLLDVMNASGAMFELLVQRTDPVMLAARVNGDAEAAQARMLEVIGAYVESHNAAVSWAHRVAAALRERVHE